MSSFFPHYIYWELSNYCNLRCKHCFAEANGSKSSIVNQIDIQNKIDELHSIGKFSIRFGGGEPFLVPYLFDLISFCTQRNIDIDITTNGILFNESVDAELQRAGLRELTFSIDGLEKQHNFLRGDGTFQKTIHSVSLALKQNQYRVSAACTVHAQNYQELEAFTSYMAQVGVKKIYFFRYCPNANLEYLSLSCSQLQYVSNTIELLKVKYPNITFVCEEFSFYTHYRGSEGCNFLKDILSINYKGDIVVCAAINKAIANIFCQPMETVLQKIETEQALIRKIPADCSQCSHRIVCHGGCKSNSFAIDGSYGNRDIFCYKKK